LLADDQHEKDHQPRSPRPRFKAPHKAALRAFINLAPQRQQVIVGRLKLRRVQLAAQTGQLNRRRQPRKRRHPTLARVERGDVLTQYIRVSRYNRFHILLGAGAG